MKGRILLRTLLTFAAAGLLLSCGKEEEDKPAVETTPGAGSSTTGVGTKYPLYVGAVAVGETPAASAALRTADSGFRNRNIASGTPSELQLTVVSMRLSEGAGSPGVPIFLSDEGKVLTVASGYADLSQLFTKIECLDSDNKVITLGAGETCECGLDANRKPIQKVTVDPVTGEEFGELRCPSVQPDATPGVGATAIDQLGTYNVLSVRIKAKAKVKGCVTGNFMYTVASSADDKSHTFCTQTDKGPYAAGKDSFTNADYESIDGSKTAELMDFALDSQTAGFETKEFVDLTFPIAGGVTIDGTTPPQITLAVDLGRALRFRGQFTDHPREEQENSTSKGSHFFALSPQAYQFVFVGKPGKIFGHEWTATAGVVDSAAGVPTTKVCDENGSDGCHKLAGWLTTIFEGDGTPIAFSLMPDDDNALTVLKGSNFGAGGFDKTVFGKKSADVYDIDYAVSSTGSQGLSGTLLAMDYSKAVGAVISTNFATKTMTNGKFSFGAISLTRGL